MGAVSSWEDITDILTPRALDLLEKGQLLRFDYEGSPLELKIMRKTLRKRCDACQHIRQDCPHGGATHIFAKKVTTHDPNEVIMTETDETGHVETINMGDMF